jgi:hypothetical protein
MIRKLAVGTPAGRKPAAAKAMTKGQLALSLLIYMLLGPPVGAMAFLLMVNAIEVVSGGTGTPLLGLLFGGLPFVLTFAYALGAIPALISSLAMVWLMRRGWSFPRRLRASMPIGAAASIAVLGWLLLGKPGNVPWYLVLGAFALTGAAAALAATLAVEPLLRRKPAPVHP